MKGLNALGLLLALTACTGTQAVMNPLSDESLDTVQAQGGVDITLDLRLNHTTPGTFDTTTCSDLRFCRIAISLNNRYHDGTQDTVSGSVITPSPTGKKEWLVFKGVQGSIYMPLLQLDGVDVTYTGSAANKTALLLTFDNTKPIEIRNFGFQSLSIERDTVAAEGAGNVPGYLASTTYAGGEAFDANNPITGQPRERGFLGLNMNGNLAIGGTIKIFSCDSTHPRC